MTCLTAMRTYTSLDSEIGKLELVYLQKMHEKELTAVI